MTATLTQPTHILDLRTIPPRERHPLILGRFGALATGESLQLVNDHNPQPLRHQFEDRAFGQFEWAALEAGPAVWRIQITRIAQSAAPSTGAKGDSCCSGGACCG
ncbi:DUF2249 domain-containing protein [Paucibacter sp. JuS9]|uniref:DUF2249 domain-containing protein n=1 Tax=Paucibacter sp. JuS9 TaxID=3228748 RepID=UPI003757E3E2